MTKTRTITLVSVAALVLAAAGVAVKMIFFPSVDDKFFQVRNNSALQRAPSGLVIVRPTHFPKPPTNGMTSATVRGAQWLVGRNVTFPTLIAAAYGYNVGRVVLPPNPPKNSFDFLVTVPEDPEARLQAAIKRKLGYTAQKEMRDTEVLALKVADPNSPGVKVSTATRQNITANNGRLSLTHLQMATLASLVEGVIKAPVVDKTALTNYYDFSLSWDPQTQQMIEGGTLDDQTGNQILAGWGLKLEPDTAPMEMLVVKKVK